MSAMLFQGEKLAGVAILILAAAFVLLPLLFRLLRQRSRPGQSGRAARIRFVARFAIDHRRNIFVVRRDGSEHTLLTGGPNDIAVGTSAASGGALPAAESAEGASSKERLGGARVAPKEPTFASPPLLRLAALSGVAGVGIGAICGFFRLALEKADRLRMSLPARWHDAPLSGCLLLIAIAAAAGAFGAFLVRRFSAHAAGSGIPQVEAAIHDELPPAPLVLLPVKFLGGLMAIGAGFALGREGPCVQMGATFAHVLGRSFHRTLAECRTLLAAGAGAGLAAAFNAPLAGAAFVLEELVRKFETNNAVAALGASGSAIVVARLFTGPAPDFFVTNVAFPSASDNLLCCVLGVIAAVLGVLYSRVLVGALKFADHLAYWPVELRAAIVGSAVGALAWFAPSLAGGGDSLTQHTLDGSVPLALLPLIYFLRLVLGAACYAAATPGGLFAPLLVLGAQYGFLFGALSGASTMDAPLHATAFAIVGMAALFTAVVRAPLTGMILVTEMTGDASQLLPMLAACFSSMAVATMLGEPPIYDTLKERAIAAWQKGQPHLAR